MLSVSIFTARFLVVLHRGQGTARVGYSIVSLVTRHAVKFESTVLLSQTGKELMEHFWVRHQPWNDKLIQTWHPIDNCLVDIRAVILAVVVWTRTMTPVFSEEYWRLRNSSQRS